MRTVKGVALILVIILVFQFTGVIAFAGADGTVTVSDSTVTLVDTDERIYEVSYTVRSTPDVQPVDVTLVLDRSGSMLYDGDNGRPIYESLVPSVKNFVDTVFNANTNNRINMVIYGTTAKAENNGQYYTASQKNIVKSLIDYNYEVSEKFRFTYKKRSWWRYTYKYVTDTLDRKAYWDNYYTSRGYTFVKQQTKSVSFKNSNGNGTNIEDAFNKAKSAVSSYARQNANHAIILFTDGVATCYGINGYWDDTTPIRVTTAISRAKNAGVSAQSVADVFTIGYFSGISNSTTKSLAKQTLRDSQNMGFYDAPSVDDLKNIYNTIDNNLNYSGTDAIITDVLEEGFSVVPGSFNPSTGYIVKTVGGKQVVEWNLGVLGMDNYDFSYRIKVNDSSFPTGKSSVYLNESIKLTYNDSVGNHTEIIGRQQINIPSLFGYPVVEAAMENVEDGYLIGDTIDMNHILAFQNDSNFDFVKLNVGTLTKTLQSGTFANAFDMNLTGWNINGNILTYPINEANINLLPTTLWEKNVALELLCMEEGTFVFNHQIDHTLTNYLGTTFNQNNADPYTNTINVAKGNITINVKDDNGVAMANVEVEFNNSTYTTDVTGKVYIENIPTAEYHMIVNKPAGYMYNGGYNNPDIIVDMNYSNATQIIDVVLEKNSTITVENLRIVTAEGNNSIEIFDNETMIDARVMFTLKNDEALDYYKLVFDVDGVAMEIETNETNYIINGDGELEKQNSIGIGTHYYDIAIQITPSALALGNTASIEVSDIKFKFTGASDNPIMPVNGDGLTMAYNSPIEEIKLMNEEKSTANPATLLYLDDKGSFTAYISVKPKNGSLPLNEANISFQIKNSSNNLLTIITDYEETEGSATVTKINSNTIKIDSISEYNNSVKVTFTANFDIINSGTDIFLDVTQVTYKVTSSSGTDIYNGAVINNSMQINRVEIPIMH